MTHPTLAVGFTSEKLPLSLRRLRGAHLAAIIGVRSLAQISGLDKPVAAVPISPIAFPHPAVATVMPPPEPGRIVWIKTS